MSWTRLRARRAISVLSDPSGAQLQQLASLIWWWQDIGDRWSERRAAETRALRGSVTQTRSRSAVCARCPQRAWWRWHGQSDWAVAMQSVTVESTSVGAGRVFVAVNFRPTRWQVHSCHLLKAPRRFPCWALLLLATAATFHGSCSCQQRQVHYIVHTAHDWRLTPDSQSHCRAHWTNSTAWFSVREMSRTSV